VDDDQGPILLELQGFGTYNYGNEINADAIPVGNEQGLYRRTFTVPETWRDRQVRIVFDGSMTDTTVWINGQQAARPIRAPSTVSTTTLRGC